MKKILLGLLIGLGLTAGIAYAQTAPTSPNYFKKIGNIISVLENNWGFRVPSLGSNTNPCVTISDTQGDFATTTCSGGAGSGISSSSVSTLILPLIANGTVAGVNATSATTSFLIQGSQNLIPFNVASSSGSSFLQITPKGNVNIANGLLGGASVTDNFLNVTGTLPAVATAGSANGINFNITSAGSSSFVQNALSITLNAGYTGSSATRGINLLNSAVGTGTNPWSANTANFGTVSSVAGAGTGFNVGQKNIVQGSSGANVGNISVAISNTNTPTLNLGGGFLALNGTTNVAGFFGLQSTAPTLTASSALISDNGATGADIFEGRNNGSIVFNVTGNGSTTITNLNTGIVQSNSGSLYTVPLNTYQPAGSYVTNSYASSSYFTLWNTQAGSNITINTSSNPTIAVVASPTFTNGIFNGTLAVTGSTTLSSLTSGCVNSTSGGALYVTTCASGGTNYWTNSGNAIFNNTGYQVGINSSTPIANLVVQGSSTAPTLDLLDIASSSNANILTVAANGNFGIGSSTPLANLSIVGTTRITTFPALYVLGGTGSGNNSTGSNATIIGGKGGNGTGLNGTGGAGGDLTFTAGLGGNGGGAGATGRGGDVVFQAGSGGLTGTGINGRAGNITFTPGQGGSGGGGSFSGSILFSPGLTCFSTNQCAVAIGTTTPQGVFTIAPVIASFANLSDFINRVEPSLTGTLATPQIALYNNYIVPNIKLGTTTSTLTSLFYNYFSSNISTGTVTNLYGIYIASSTLGSGATVNNKYSFVSEPTSGNFGISTTTPAYGFVNVGTAQFAGLAISAGGQPGAACFDAAGQLINDTFPGCVVSSKRFKDNIKPSTLGLDLFLNLHPVTYNFKTNWLGSDSNNPNYNGTQEGLIAEDVQKVAPDLITVEIATSTWDNAPPGTPHGLQDFTHWLGPITLAFQQQQKEIQNITVGKVKDVQDKWQDILLGLFGIYIIYNEYKRRTP